MENRIFILELLENYSSYDEAEELVRKEIINFVKENRQCFETDFEPGHITGGALIVDTDRKHALLTHHAKLHKWIQFGGHSDGHWNPLEVAWREAHEESGLTTLAYFPGKEGVFDLDIHPIPARGEMPLHKHYDVRILLSADRNEQFVVTHESHDIQWIPLEDVSKYNSEPDFLRMVNKVT